MFRRDVIVASGWRLQALSAFTATMILLASGCSRVVSPPGQSVFTRPGQSPNQNEGAWNLAGQRPANPSTQGAAYPQNVGEGAAAVPKMLTEKERLDQQYAQSARLVRAQPPRLIPIESIETAGAPEVVSSSSSKAIPASGNGKTIVLSDAISASPTTEQAKTKDKDISLEQAKLVQEEKKKAFISSADVSVVPATLIAVPQAESKITLASGVENIEETKSSYHQSARSESRADSETFNPDAFAADRRAIPVAASPASPANQVSKVSTESKAAPAPASQNKPMSAETTKAPAFGDDALLDAAGIKVDKDAFDFSPAKKVPAENPNKSEKSEAVNSKEFKSSEAEKPKLNSASEFSASEFPAKDTAGSPMKPAAEPVANPSTEPKPFKEPASTTLAMNPLPEKLNGQFSPAPAEKMAVCEKAKSANCISPEELSKANWVALPEPTTTQVKSCETACKNSDVAAVGVCDANKTCGTEKSSALPAPAKLNTDFLPMNQPKPVSSSLQKSELDKPIPSSFIPTLPVPASFVADSKVAELKISNPCFCTEIKGFGQVTRFPTNTFKGSQKTLIYCEVENYSSKEEKDAKGALNFVTRLKGRYEIFDSSNQSVQSGQFPDIEDITNRKRRDFYLYFPVAFKDLASGEYELKVWVEEKDASAGFGDRKATSSLRFTVGK